MDAVVPQHSCRLLTLPRAIRDCIYDLVFAIQQTTASINLAKANPPSEALLLSCRQIYAESKAKHQAATQSYWQDNTFYVFVTHHINARDTKASKAHAAAAVVALKNIIVEHIRLEIRWQALTNSDVHIGGKDWYDRELHAWRHDLDSETEVEDPAGRNWCSILVPNEPGRVEALYESGFRVSCGSDDCMLQFAFRKKGVDRIEEARELGGCAGSMKEEIFD